jgi:hypothetical protein
VRWRRSSAYRLPEIRTRSVTSAARKSFLVHCRKTQTSRARYRIRGVTLNERPVDDFMTAPEGTMGRAHFVARGTMDIGGSIRPGQTRMRRHVGVRPIGSPICHDGDRLSRGLSRDGRGVVGRWSGGGAEPAITNVSSRTIKSYVGFYGNAEGKYWQTISRKIKMLLRVQ